MNLVPSEVIGANRARFVEPNGDRYWISPIMGERPGHSDVGPQAALLEPDDSVRIRPHFHVRTQIQLVVSGGAKFGRWHIQAPWAHYVDAYTTYGPIVPEGDSPLKFFTLRIDGPDFQHYMPESKHEKIKRSGRNLVALTGTEFAFAQNPAVGDAVVEPILGPYPDGLATYLIKAGRDATLTIPPDPARGEFWVVLEGSIVVSGTEFFQHSCGCWNRGDNRVTVTSGGIGATVFVARFPDCASTDGTGHT
jgi:hypothetical protein